MRDFMASRRIGGRQQIKTAITFHTAGEQILWPYGYTKTDVPVRHDARTTMLRWWRSAARWPPPTATRRCSRATCTSPTATRSTGRTASQHIFMYTFELYPSHARSARPPGSTRRDEVIAPQTERNREAILLLIEAAGCPYTVDRHGEGRTAARCSTTSRRTAAGRRTRSAPTPRRPGAGSAATRPRRPGRPGPSPSGSRALVTGRAGGSAAAHDVDGGVTTVRSAPIVLPDDGRLADLPLLPRPQRERVVERLLPRLRRARGRDPDARPPGARRGEHRPAVLGDGLVPMTPWAGETVRIVFAGRRPRRRQHDRGGRRRRPDHPSVSGSRTRIVVPPPGARLGLDLAAVGDHELAGDRQPEPGAARVVALDEPVEDVREQRGVDARARVADLEADPAPGLDRARRRVTRPPAGVWRRALATRLARTSRMRTGSTSMIGRSPSIADAELTPAASAAGSNERTTSATSRSGSVGSRWRASVPASDRASVRRSSISRPRTRVSSRIGPRCAAIRRVDAVDDRLEVALDDGQRRPQLVADVGEEGPPLALVGLEPLGHRVEARGSARASARPRLAAAGRRGPSSRRPRPAGRLDQPVERSPGGPERPARCRPAAR